MGWSRKILVAAWLCALAAITHSAAVNTENTLIVTNEDTKNSPKAPETHDSTTEGPLPPIKLTKMDVKSDVSMRYAHTAIVTHVKNPAKRSQEAVFRVLLPETAFITGFQMTLDGKTYKAYVKEKEEAKKDYMEAVSHGISAAHIATKARDSNHFTVSVNVEPSSTAIFNLTCEELLVRRNGLYHHLINLHPGTLVPGLTVTVHIHETQKITTLRVPEIKTGNEIDADENDPENTQVSIERKNDDEATIVFKPDLEEQKRLMEIYAQKSKESLSHRNRFSYYDSPEESKVDGVLGQFVVLYDVEHSKDGKVLVNDGYFVHTFAPSSLPPLNKQVVFVLDTSGSMSGRKMEQLKQAMLSILDELNMADYFSIVEFSSSVKVHNLEEVDSVSTTTRRPYYFYDDYEKPTVLLPPSKATPKNVGKAKTIINGLEANGGTNIDSALHTAIALTQKGIRWTPGSNNTEVVPEKDSKAVEQAVQENNKTDVNQLEPVIIFLTDGEATSGVTDSRRIINNVAEKNYGSRKASIYTLGFGEDADRNLLRKLALCNDGFMRHIYEAADAALQLRDFYRQLASPQMAHVKFVYPENQIKDGTLTKTTFRTIFGGSEVIVAGRVNDGITELTPEIFGFHGIVDEGFARIPHFIRPIIRIPEKPKPEYWPLERLWAYMTIKQRLDESEANEDADKPEDKEKGPKAQALKLALQYHFVTPLTSLVVVKPNATNAVDAESVDIEKITPFYPSLPGAPGGAVSFAQANYISGGSGGFAAPSAAFYPMAPMAPMSFDKTALIHRGPGLHGAFRPPGAAGPGGLFGSNYITTTFRPILRPITIYQLDSFDWVEPLLKPDTDELVLPVNGTDVHLKLSKDFEAPKSAAGDEECAHATDGSVGTCVYLTRCDAAHSITVALYADTYCKINNEYAGICCPKSGIATSTP